MPINEYATVDSFYSLSKWIGGLNEQAKNNPKPGFKAERVTFTGGPTKINQLTVGLQQTGEGGLAIKSYIDYSQGRVAGSYRPYHLAVKGDGFFILCPPGDINQTTGAYTGATNGKLMITRDGEFKRDAQGLLVHTRTGYYLTSNDYNGAGWTAAGIRAVYDNSRGVPNVNLTNAVNMTDFFAQTLTPTTKAADNVNVLNVAMGSLFRYPGNTELLTQSKGNNTIFDFGHVPGVLFKDPKITTMGLSSLANNDIVPSALELSNAPLEQFAPELAQAQRMYDNLTKILSARKSNFELLTSLFR